MNNIIYLISFLLQFGILTAQNHDIHLSVEIGGTANFNCSASHSNTSHNTDYFKIETGEDRYLVWWSNDEDISFGDDTFRQRITKTTLDNYGDSSISLHNITKDDEGGYKCFIIYTEPDTKYSSEYQVFYLSAKEITPSANVDNTKTVLSPSKTLVTTTKPTITTIPTTIADTTTTNQSAIADTTTTKQTTTTTDTTTTKQTTTTTDATTTKPTTTTETTTTTKPTTTTETTTSTETTTTKPTTTTDTTTTKPTTTTETTTTTEMTTTVPDTTLPPTTTTVPPTPKHVLYNVTENNVTCMMVDAHIAMSIIYTTNKAHKHYFTRNLTIPFFEDGGRVSTNSCTPNKDGTQTLNITWSTSTKVNNQTLDWPSSLAFVFNKTNKNHWKLSFIKANIPIDGVNFPNATHENETIFMKITPDYEPSTSTVNMSYVCKPNISMNVAAVYHANPYPFNISVYVEGLHMQAFNLDKPKEGSLFMEAEECGTKSSNVVPIAVGVVLAVLAVGVAAGFVGRKFYLKRYSVPPYGPL